MPPCKVTSAKKVKHKKSRVSIAAAAAEPPRTPSPQPTLETARSPNILSAQTPSGAIYTNVDPDYLPPNPDDVQVSDDEDEDRPPPPADLEPEGGGSAFRTKEEEAKRAEVTASLALIIAEQLAAKNRELAALAKEATLGYCAFPLVDPPQGMGWGKWNKRGINKPESRKLRNSMEINGLNNSDPATVIRIGVRKEWLQGELTDADKLWGKSVLDLAPWKLTPAGVQAVKEGKAIPFSGNHRRDALTDYQKTSEKRVKNLEAEMKRMVPRGNTQMSIEAISAYETMKDGLVVLKDINEKAKLWGAQLYDLGE